MPNDDAIPSNDDEFDRLQSKLIAAAAANPAKLGLTTQDLAALQATQITWAASYAHHVKEQEEAQKATEAKNAARALHEPNLRAMVRKIHATPGVENTTRIEAGLAPREVTVRKSVGVPLTRPLGRLEVKGRLTVVIHFVDETTPLRLAKPAGVHGCQLFSFIGDTPPTDPAEYVFLAVDTRTPYTDEHDAGDAGKLVHYRLRWQNTKGETGPWSDPVSIRIPS